MKIHEAIPEEFHPALLKKAKEVGLDQIDFESGVCIAKLRRKDENKATAVEEGYCLKGLPFLIGNGEFVALYVSGWSEWLRTSPIVAVKKVDKGFEVETENSIYGLRN